MKRLILLIAATALTASPGAGQMNMPSMKMPVPKKKANPKKTHGHERMTGSEMRSTSSPQSAPGTPMPSNQTMEKMPGMNMPTGEHAGHTVAGKKAPEPEVAPPPPGALQGPKNAADTVYGAAPMQPSRTFLMTKEHGGMTAAKLLVDQMETRVRRGRDGYFVNAQGWYGEDTDKLWLKSEIEGDYGRTPDQAELQALWSHALGPWFDLQAGVRLDAQPHPRGRLVLGLEGLAPYWWQVDAATFISTKGDITARVEASHDLRITQKLIVQPRTQLDFALQDIPSERVGSGLSKAEIGARLRYQFEPNFAPYVGVVYERAVGHSARFVRADGESPGGLQFTVGLRTWF